MFQFYVNGKPISPNHTRFLTTKGEARLYSYYKPYKVDGDKLINGYYATSYYFTAADADEATMRSVLAAFQPEGLVEGVDVLVAEHREELAEQMEGVIPEILMD